MTDLEISKALALAIGWPADKVAIHHDMWEVMVQIEPNPFGWKVFNHMDWAVAGPIAERYDCFPIKTGKVWNSRFMWRGCGKCADTPQRAIAMAVIAGAKK